MSNKWWWVIALVVAVIIMQRFSAGSTSPGSAGPAPNVGTAGYGAGGSQFNSDNGAGAPGFGATDTGGGIFGESGGW